MDHRMLLRRDQVAVMSQLIYAFGESEQLSSRPAAYFLAVPLPFFLSDDFPVFWPWPQWFRGCSVWTDADSGSGRTNTSSYIRYFWRWHASKKVDIFMAQHKIEARYSRTRLNPYLSMESKMYWLSGDYGLGGVCSK